MNIKNKVTRVALSSLAVGSLAVFGLAGVSSAFADGPDDGYVNPNYVAPPGVTTTTPSVVPTDPSSPFANGAVPSPTVNYTGDTGYANPNYVSPTGDTSTQTYYDPSQYYYGQYPYNYGQYPYNYGQYPYNYGQYPSYPTYPTYTYTYGSTNQFFIQGASETLGIPTSQITSQLAQGWTLTQIAAQYGFSRDYFLSVLVPRVQSDLIYGINNGTIDPGTGNALLANLLYTAGSVIDTAYIA